MSDSLWPHGLQHARLPCPSLSPRFCSNSSPLSWWCYLTKQVRVPPKVICNSYPEKYSSVYIYNMSIWEPMFSAISSKESKYLDNGSLLSGSSRKQGHSVVPSTVLLTYTQTLQYLPIKINMIMSLYCWKSWTTIIWHGSYNLYNMFMPISQQPSSPLPPLDPLYDLQII